MRLCAELADLGMDLARTVAAKARDAWAQPEELPEPESATEPSPETEVAPPIRLAQAARPPRINTLYVRAASCKSGDPALVFTRLAACVRASIALEARVAAGLTPIGRATSPTLRNDPRRAPLRDVFRRITQHHPDRAELVRETTDRIDEDLQADPARTLDLSRIFFSICEDLEIEVDLATLPDAFLGLAPDEPDPAEPDRDEPDRDEPDEAATNAPYPRATSPP
jgi:hypothetical protein